MSVQMTCPYCKQEFPFDNGKLDREISEISQRITAINRELASIKALPKKARQKREGRRKVLVNELTALMEKISGLKTIRKVCDQQIRFYKYKAVCNIVRDRFGEEEYWKIMHLVEEEIKAYDISSMMRHEYTRSPHKSNVTSINKL